MPVFPLPAVLICTIGSLVALLFAFARQGQSLANQTIEPTAAQSEPSEQREDIEWRMAQIERSRAQTEDDLAKARLKLSHVEDHLRRLREEFERLTISAEQLKHLGAAGNQQRSAALAELDVLRKRIAEEEEALAISRRTAQSRPVTYSVVPYVGPNQTRRRPIYIECLLDAIVLQPEGITLNATDFEGPAGPGNPLAAAMRAAREYMAGRGEQGEPYPLLLVRPEGIVAYYYARTALASWGSEFGYELIGDDWQLEFPDPDPELARLQQKVIGEARLRQRELVLSAPRAYKRGKSVTFRASPDHGFVPDNRGGGSGGSPSRQPGGAGGFAGGGGHDSPPGGSFGASGSGAGGPSGGAGDRPAGSGGAFGSSGGANPRSAGSGGAFGASGDAANAVGGGDFTAKGSEGKPGLSGEPGGTTPSGTKGPAGGKDQAKGQDSPGSAGAGGLSKSKSPSAAPDDMGAADFTASGGGSGSPSNSSSGGGAPGAGSAASAQSPPGKKSRGNGNVNSLAKTRGDDWGLPGSGAGSVAVNRPLIVQCRPDRLIILPESGTGGGKEIVLGERTQDSVDEFVSSVWQHMKTWGIAGKGLYWRPTLVVDVDPAAAERYAELKTLLTDSGLEVREREKKTPAAQARPNRIRR